jgi:hypothetical protein
VREEEEEEEVVVAVAAGRGGESEAVGVLAPSGGGEEDGGRFGDRRCSNSPRFLSAAAVTAGRFRATHSTPRDRSDVGVGVGSMYAWYTYAASAAAYTSPVGHTSSTRTPASRSLRTMSAAAGSQAPPSDTLTNSVGMGTPRSSGANRSVR